MCRLQVVGLCGVLGSLLTVFRFGDFELSLVAFLLEYSLHDLV